MPAKKYVVVAHKFVLFCVCTSVHLCVRAAERFYMQELRD